jgi:hypothetical protein
MADTVERLERDTLCNIVLPKHLQAFGPRCRVHHVADANGGATLVLLEAAASPCDRRTCTVEQLVRPVFFSSWPRRRP